MSVKRVMSDQIDAHGGARLGPWQRAEPNLAVALPSPVDHLMLSLPGHLGERAIHGRYAIASPLTNRTLWDALFAHRRLCDDLGIIINRKEDARCKADARLRVPEESFHMARAERLSFARAVPP